MCEGGVASSVCLPGSSGGRTGIAQQIAIQAECEPFFSVMEGVDRLDAVIRRCDFVRFQNLSHALFASTLAWVGHDCVTCHYHLKPDFL